MASRADVLTRLKALEVTDCRCETWVPCQCCRECRAWLTCRACSWNKRGKRTKRCSSHKHFRPHPNALQVCEHVEALYAKFPCVPDAKEQMRRDADLTIVWARLLEWAYNGKYSERPKADSPTASRRGSKARVACYTQRVALGLSPWHPGDVNNVESVGCVASREPNGRECELGPPVALPAALERQRELEGMRASDRKRLRSPGPAKRG